MLNTINIKHSVILILSFLFFSCSQKIEIDNKSLLNNAIQVLENNPEQALQLLKQIKTEQFKEKDYNYFVLLQVRAWDILGMNILPSKDEVDEVRDYFINKNDITKVVIAYFVTARIYEKQREVIKALYYYQLADEWAKKVNCVIPDFIYAKIPYNIATLLFYDHYFKESINYLNKSIKYFDSENVKYIYKLDAFDLKALNFKNLNIIDSSLIYYDKALQIANINNDTVAKNRINYNKCALYFIAKDYDLTEKNCNATIEKTSITDSINLGRLYLAQAAIYDKTNRTNLANYSIYKAKELLINAEYDTKVLLLKILSKTEKQRNNPNKAEEYKKQYFALKTEYENAQNLEKEELRAEIAKQKELLQDKEITKTLSFIKSNWLLGQKYRANIKTVIAIIALLTIALSFSLYRLLKTKRHDKEIADIRKFGKETLLRGILQRKDLIVLLEELDNYIHNNKRLTKKNLELLADKIDSMIPQVYWQDNPGFFQVHYRTMFENFKTDFPMLNEIEYRILCLTCTQIFKPAEIAAILRIDEKEYQQARQTMENKIKVIGYNLKDLMIYAQQTFKITPDENVYNVCSTTN